MAHTSILIKQHLLRLKYLREAVVNYQIKMEKSTKIFGSIEKDTALKVGVAIGIAAALGGALYLFGKKDEENKQAAGPQGEGYTSKNQSTVQGSSKGREFHQPHLDSPTAHLRGLDNESTVSVLAHSVKHERQMYSMKTLTLISEMLEDNCSDEYANIVRKSRVERRALGQANMAKYQQIVEEELIETDNLISETIQIILEKIGGDFEVYKASIEYWTQKDQRFAMLQMMMVEKMKIGMKTSRDRSKLTNSIAKDMMRYQVQIYPNLNLQVENPEFEMLVKKSLLQDKVFEKFGFEEEDLVVLPHIGHDHEFAQLAHQLQMLIQMDQMKAFGMMGGMPF